MILFYLVEFISWYVEVYVPRAIGCFLHRSRANLKDGKCEMPLQNTKKMLKCSLFTVAPHSISNSSLYSGMVGVRRAEAEALGAVAGV